jgi:hypothetical protein
MVRTPATDYNNSFKQSPLKTKIERSDMAKTEKGKCEQHNP